MPGYVYSEQRSKIFTEEGQVLYIKVRDHIAKLLTASRAVRMDAILNGSYGGRDDWSIMACVDRMLELEEICECHYGASAAQHRVFVTNRTPS